MSKIIISFDEDKFTFFEASLYVDKVIGGGRVSEDNSYCAVTIFNSNVRVYARRTKGGTDMFKVLRPLASVNKIIGKTAHTLIIDELGAPP